MIKLKDILNEETIFIDDVYWQSNRSNANAWARKYKIRVDSFNYAGGYNSLEIRGEKKNLLKAFTSKEYNNYGHPDMDKDEVLTLYPQLK
tara:strand:+ start:857 stop:1126 length:270 start_codon:yes stop_codon:yes gene_type:complete